MSIASRASFSDDSRKLKNLLPKSLLLRDYLLDDMSSCSSNGFRSYPRRQCCTTVRFLIETDLNKNHKMFSKPHRTSNMKPKQSSMLQKASEVMIKAFKRLPFGASTKAKLLPRSFSRKLLKHGFWNKTDQPNNKTKRLTTFGDLIKEEDVTPLPLPSSSPSLLRLSTAVTSAVTVEIRSLTSNSDSWSATTESLTSTGNSSEVNLAQNDVADELHEKMKRTDGNRVGVTTVTATVNHYSDATENAKKWQGNQDEQFSPVSVMDFPSDSGVDEEDEVSSMSPRTHLNVKGAKIATHKTRISDRVPQLEPVKLEDRIAQSVLESSTTTFHDFVQEKNQVEKKALVLLKSTVSSHHLLKYEAVEGLLLEFLKESILEENVSDYEVLQRAKDWMDGQEEQDIFIDWECENNRQTYLREMEKGVKWSNYDHQVEKVNVGLEVECEIFNSLVNDVLTEFHLQEFGHEDRDF